MSYNSANATDIVSVQGLIEPVAGAATYTTSWFDAGSCCAWLATIAVGTAGTSVDAKIEQATDVSGTGAKDLGSGITQIDGDGESALIQFKPSDLDGANDFTHVRLSITTVGATAVAGGTLCGVNARYAPLAAGAKVDETVTINRGDQWH
jgi:hypothetical protein